MGLPLVYFQKYWLLSNSSCTNFELHEFFLSQKMCISRPYCTQVDSISQSLRCQRVKINPKFQSTYYCFFIGHYSNMDSFLHTNTIGLMTFKLDSSVSPYIIILDLTPLSSKCLTHTSLNSRQNMTDSQLCFSMSGFFRTLKKTSLN